MTKITLLNRLMCNPGTAKLTEELLVDLKRPIEEIAIFKIMPKNWEINIRSSHLGHADIMFFMTNIIKDEDCTIFSTGTANAEETIEEIINVAINKVDSIMTFLRDAK